MAVSFILSKGCISVMIGGKMYQIREGNQNYEKVKKTLKTATPEEMLQLVDPKVALAPMFKAKAITFKDGKVFADGKPVSSTLAKRYAELASQGMPLVGYEKFIENVFKNPSEESVKDLYDFLEACSLPITEDGCFLAYKRITSDWKDCHTNSIDNHIGQKPKMNREDCDGDRHSACSRGLHVCSLGYLGSFGGARTVVVKVNPKDVVAVPVDHSCQKMRCCEYEVIEELKDGETIPDYTADTSDDVEESNDSDDSIDSTLVDKAVPINLEVICEGLDSGYRLKVMDAITKLQKYATDRKIPSNFYDKLDSIARRGLYRCAERLLYGHETTGSVPEIREVKDTLENLYIALAKMLVAKYKNA